MRNYIWIWVVAGWVASLGPARSQSPDNRPGNGGPATRPAVGPAQANQRAANPTATSVGSGTATKTVQPPAPVNRLALGQAETKAGVFARAFQASNGTDFAPADSVLRYAGQAVLALGLNLSQTEPSVKTLLDSLRRGTDHDGLLYYALGYVYENKPAGADWPNALKWYKYAFQVGYEPAYFRLLNRYRRLFSTDNIEWITANFNRRQAGFFVRCRLANGTQRTYPLYLPDYPQNPADPLEPESRRLLEVYGATPVEADRARFSTLYQDAARQKIGVNELAARQILARPASPAPVVSPAVVASLSPAPPVPAEPPAKAVAVDPKKAGQLQYEQGLTYQQQNDLSKATELFGQAVGADPKNADYQHALAAAYAKNKQPAPAVEAYQKLLVLAPGRADYLNELADVYAANGQYAESVDPYRRAADLAPAEGSYRQELGNAYFLLNQYGPAVVAFQTALDLTPGLIKSDLPDRLGLSLDKLDRKDEALRVFERAVVARPQQAPLYQYYQGRIYLQTDRAEKAIDRLRQATAAVPTDPDYRRLLALAYAYDKQWSRSVAEYETLLTLAPQRADYLNETGDACFGAEKYEMAIGYYKKAIDLAPGDASHYKDLGDVYYLSKQYDAGLAAFEKTLALAPPNSPDALNALNSMGTCLTYLKRYEEGLACFRKGIAQYGTDGAAGFAYNMACNYALQGKAAEAIQALDLTLGTYKYQGTADSIRTDPDFATLRNTTAFVSLLAKYFPL